jgi:tetratricopeptide (TPR) repeat protein
VAGLEAEAAEAAFHAAQSEFKLRRPERALDFLETAVKLDPRHADALGLLAERAIDQGDVARGIELLERHVAATSDGPTRGSRFERLADVIGAALGDTPRAAAACARALEAVGAAASDALLEKALVLERDAGRIAEAAEVAARLLEREAPRPERVRRLRDAAALDAALGQSERARTRLRAALELDPLDQAALAGLSALYAEAGADEEAAQLLTRALPKLPAAADAGSVTLRATLWTRLGECRARLRDAKGALTAFERALDADPSRRALRESLLERYGDDPAHDPVVRAHRLRLLAEDPLHLPSLRAMTRIEARGSAPDRGRRFFELLAVAGAITDEERRALATSAPPERIEEALPGALDEEDHATLAHPDALPLAGVFAALWEAVAARAPDLAALGVRPEDRVSPVAQSDLARAYSLCARALGNRKTGLYLHPDATFAPVELVAQPPTAVVVGRHLTEGRSLTDVRFLLGRALEVARPEYVLAAALDPGEFTRLFGAILRAFHPRHARPRLETGGAAARDDEAAAWKKGLPYKVARRLAELFQAHADTEFSSASWRRGVQHTANRAGLLVAGDLIAATRVLNAEGDREGVQELARFAVSDAYARLRAKLQR